MKADRIIRRLGFTNWIRVEATGYAGGIWMLWNESCVDVMYSFSTTQLLHCKVNYKDSPTAFWITAVYAEPNFCNRKVLWGDLENLAMHMNEPWVVLGYFNAYQSPADKTKREALLQMLCRLEKSLPV